MHIDQFIESYQPKFFEYCPGVLDEEGQMFECPVSHLQTLLDLVEEKGIQVEFPENVSHLFYLTIQLHCVLVDYENQIYSEELTNAQTEALHKLAKAGLIHLNLKNIKKNYFL